VFLDKNILLYNYNLDFFIIKLLLICLIIAFIFETLTGFLYNLNEFM